MSIQNLVDTYKGNPAPLASAVQQAQKNQPSGAIPPDLEQAMALQQIQELHQAAAAQQAMQAGGPQPTVVQKLQQMLGQMRQQAQPQGMMAQAPQGMPQGQPQGQPQPQGGINQLPTNIGQHMAGGGIVAFAGDDERVGSEVPEPKHKYRQYTLQEQGADWEAQRQAAREAEAANRSPEAKKDSEGIMKALGFVGNLPLEALKTLVSAPGYGFNKDAPRAPAAAAPIATDDPMRDLVYRLPPQQPPAPRPPVAQPPRAPAAQAPSAQPAQPAQPAQQGLGALLEQNVRADLGRDRDVEAQKMVAKQRELSGMTEYQKQMADIMQTLAAQQEEAKSNRTPEWVRAAQSLGGAPIRGGIGMLLGRLGQGATAARDAYGAEDAAYADKLNTLKKAAMDAQLKGNTELAKTYAEQYREVDSARRAAMTSGTSLENTRVLDATRRQNALDAAAARAQADRFRHEDRTTAAAERTDAHYKEQAMRLAMAAAVKEKEMPANFARLKDVSAEELAARKFDAIYNALKTGKMMPAPGAPSPGGTPADISALLNKYGGK